MYSLSNIWTMLPFLHIHYTGGSILNVILYGERYFYLTNQTLEGGPAQPAPLAPHREILPAEGTGIISGANPRG